MQAITATYEEHDDEWSVTVAGMGREMTEHAPGIIAARDQAEQLVDSLKPEDDETAVVHLLHGSALEFTTAYMTARLSRSGDSGLAGDAIPEQTGGEQDSDDTLSDAGESADDTADAEGADESAQELAQ